MRKHMGLFRGKRTDNGEWVTGYYCRAFRWTGDNYPQPAIQEADCFMFRLIDPNTVGECTGLRDRDGRLIFEGDILRYVMDDGTLSEWCCEVAFGTYNCTCCDGVYGWYLNGDCGDIRDFEKEEDAGPYVIVGNIHDNPELMEKPKLEPVPKLDLESLPPVDWLTDLKERFAAAGLKATLVPSKEAETGGDGE